MKQQMIVVCKPEDSMAWFDKLWSYTVEFFRSWISPCARSSAAPAIWPI
ncbi:MAG: hypothetical protein V8Q85_02755 [Christensenellales bacterium]